MKLKRLTPAVIGIVAIMLAAPASASADAPGDWNAIAVTAITTACPAPTCVPAIPARPGPTGVLDVAMVHAAIYDAVQAIERDFEPYYVEIPGATGSPVAATAKAAHDVLVNRFPWQSASLDMIYNNYLAARFIPQNDPGVAVGAAAAAGIIALRANDGSFPNPPPPAFNGGTTPGTWRPTLPNFASMLAPWLGSVTPFFLTSPSQFRAHPPPALTSPEYTRDYNEIKSLGSLNSIDRTPEQTDLAHFWNSNFVVLLNTLLRDIDAAHVNNISDSSRLFALAEMSMADAVITAWENKVFYVNWRPITGIREAHTDGNPRTARDENWLPLIPTPPYPDHTSGANNITAAATRTLALLFGNHVSFSITTTNPGPTVDDTRDYIRFSDVQLEVVDARVYQGIHWRYADEEGRKQGRHIAQWAFSHFLKPLGGN